MLDPRHLVAFAAICETGSFERAAARVGVTPSAVSQRMRALSEAAGGAIFARTGPAEPTALGRRLLRHAREAAALEAGLLADLGRDGGAPSVAIAMGADALEVWGARALAAAEGPRWDVTIDDQDHAAALLRAGEVSAAVCSEAAPLPGCDAHRLAPMRYRAVCAPGFARRWFPEGPTAEALRAAPVLRFDPKDALQVRWMEAVAPQLDPPAHAIPATGAFRQACVAGIGWGMNPEGMVAGDLRAGRLVDLGRPLDVALWWQVARSAAALLAPLTRAMRRASRDAGRP